MGLDKLQRDLLTAFFRTPRSFFLTGGVRVDRSEEIRANKLASLLGRAEIRDLVDLLALERAGYPVDRSALADAARKDAGLTAAQLAWVLSELRLGPDLSPPGGATVEELEAFRCELRERLVAWAHP
ncbi:MAG: nucleotidyl transferase AbiEii/AbiGii toxin family protein [Thermoanaerobaculia bacterium]|nr:nucleotidyl transferase AbiEii/AbiGii toxin family protein [Thermoanaerobaculia bacterium]